MPAVVDHFQTKHGDDLLGGRQEFGGACIAGRELARGRRGAIAGLDRDFLRSLLEFKQWDETGFMMGVKQKMLKASARAAGRAESLAESREELRQDFRKYKELEDTLRQKVKNWCRAMAEELA